MSIKGLKISMIVSISFDTEGMPRLNPQQREQAIGIWWQKKHILF
jgi:hypothetical protein